MKILSTRAVTGILFVMVMLSAVWAGQWIAGGLFLLIAIGGHYEFLQLVRNRPVNPIPELFAGAVVYGVTFLSLLGHLPEGAWIILPLVLLSWLSLSLRNANSTLNAAGLGILGIFYIPFCLAITVTASSFAGFFDPYAVTGLLLIIWLYDTGAFLTGTIAGRTKLLSRISPKKTIEGVAGGTLIALITAFLWGYFVPGQSIFFWLIAALAIVVAGTMGDLFESWLKRQQNVKDSGSLLPGHGGILDRFDALLFAGPVFHFISIYTF